MESFGRYTLFRLAGSGGMAQVHLARQIGPGGFVKPCVLKRIAPEHRHNETYRRLFLEEARISALLSHRNVVQTFDFGEVDGIPFMAMELVDGVNLAQLLKLMTANERWIALGPAVAVVRAVLEALDYAHGLRDLDGKPLKLVHRDVTPQNILLSRSGDVKLADFGIARHEARDEQTIGPQVKGKPGYMALEQAFGGEIDGRADLFSLGIILIELIAARRVHDSKTAIVSHAAMPERLLELCRSRSDSPPELNTFAVRLASLDVADRPRSAREAIEQLDALADKVPSARPLPEFLERVFDRYFPVGVGSAGSITESDTLAASWTADDDQTESDAISIVYEGWPAEFAPDRPPPPLAPAVPEAAVPEAAVPDLPPLEPKRQTATTTFQVLARASDVEAMKQFSPEISDEAKKRGKVEVDRAPQEAATAPPPKKSDPRGPLLQLGLGALAIGLFGLGIASVIAKGDDRAPVAPTGRLTITSKPSGAKIFIDGRATNQVTPTAIDGLPADIDLTVAVRLDHHRSTPRQAVVRIPSARGYTAASFKLERGRVFRIDSDPEGARVEVEGRRPEVTPVDLEALPFGETTKVTVVLRDYLPVDLALTADAKTATVTLVKLEPAKEIDILSSPEAAEVTIDGRKLGPTPRYDVAVPLNRSFTVTVTKRGYKPSRQRLSGKKIDERQLAVNLDPLPLAALPLTKEQRQRAKVLDGALSSANRKLRAKRAALKKAERQLDLVESTPNAFIADLAEAQRAVDVTRAEIETLEQAKDDAAGEVEQFREELR